MLQVDSRRCAVLFSTSMCRGIISKEHFSCYYERLYTYFAYFALGTANSQESLWMPQH